MNSLAKVLIVGICLLLTVSERQVLAQGSGDVPLDQLFTIRNIRVDETDRSSDRARRRALLRAEEEAYDKLLRKITQLEDRSKLPDLSVEQRQALISGLEFVDEQSSSRRYVATLNVRFEPSRVSSFLAEYGVPHVLGTGRPVLVLHRHKRGLATFLWNADSILGDARDAVDWENRIRGYKFSFGNINERRLLSANDVGDFDVERAIEAARLNGFSSATLISSELITAEDDTKTLAYSFLATDSGVSGSGELPAEDEIAAITQMYDEILEVIDGSWRERLLVDTGSAGDIDVLVPSLNLEQLAEVERRLNEVTLVQAFQTTSIGVPISAMHIQFTGREDQLALALRFEGLDLKPYGDQVLLELRDQ